MEQTWPDLFHERLSLALIIIELTQNPILMNELLNLLCNQHVFCNFQNAYMFMVMF